jgi:F-type H+-transporting ATPase subunit epsilon
MVPDGEVVRERIGGLQASDATGRFGLLPNHEAFQTLLVPCVVNYRIENGMERFAAVDGGVLLSENNRITIVSREAVTAERLEDVADTAAAMLASRQAREKSAREEFTELQTALLRELGEVQRTR